MKKKFRVLLFFSSGLLLSGCSHDHVIDYTSIDEIVYSRHVQPIFTNNCLSSGCHNSRDRANGLELTSWQSLIRGSEHGAVIISGHGHHSHLIEHLKGERKPRMPLNRPPLPDEQIEFLERWIEEGARNDAGQRPYENLDRKVYVSNQGADFITVISVEHNLVTRLLPVGDSPALDVPHNLFIDANKRFLYVSLIASGEIWKFDTLTDTFVGKAQAGTAPANVVVNPDGSRAYVTNWDITNPNGRAVQVIDTATLVKIRQIDVGLAPHGISFSHDGKLIYVTNYLSDSISILNAADNTEVARVLLAPDVNPVRSSKYQPLQVALTPDDRFAYVSCYASNEVRVVDTAGKTVVAVVPVGKAPFLLDVTPDGRFVYVANQQSDNMSVIRVADNQVIATIESPAFANPHGIAFTADGRYAYITNENLSGEYNPHHPSEHGAHPGNVTVIDTAKNQVIKVIEVEADPTGVAVVER
ncbi:MAG: beta-propeller fold lactonase family protein [candidate division KSB1 bacterium]|nr:beta-propeller fold lactonase family protein [candidate division KSB1 bacterium]MDZ7367580.1 beta-propeller fold lactonase family protein [candidate division KSB1 bacterium]MDZ7405372.1 beta-propeller fold lactonase family protein [candidate division KSB1 bacterium]